MSEFKRGPKTLTTSFQLEERLARIVSPTHVKRYALIYAREKRAHSFTRVSETFINAVESEARWFIRDRVARHPSKGVTLT
jgi:hypothetical protein